MKRAVHDFLTTLFPLPSSFELPPGERNRFLSQPELRQWEANLEAKVARKERMRMVVWAFLSLLAVVALVCFLRDRFRLRRRRRGRDDGIGCCC